MTLSMLPPGFHQTLTVARLRLLRLYHEAHSGHIGSSLSCLDALLLLQLAVMTNADRFVLSKGHAAGALYVTLWAKGLLPEETLATSFGEDSVLPGHPSGAGVPGLLFPTGSLGHGPSLAAGLALALRHRRESGRVFCLCSDGEWQEGSCWEALSFAVRQGLDNLILLVDQNGWQGFGTTREVSGVADLAPRFEIFGAGVDAVDGHDPEALLSILSKKHADTAPRVIVLHTRKGRGLHFEDTLESHYLPMTPEQYEEGVRRIRRELEEAGS
jgi:transketolase